MTKNTFSIPRQTIAEFAKLAADTTRDDRWLLIGCSGEMGEGKSCFTDQLVQATAKEIGTPFSYRDNMTYSRKQLRTWMDGDANGEGQKQEYSALLIDELISLFFNRNWFDTEQIDGVELLNKCRDRHHVVVGNIPVLWHLDSAVLPLISYWIHIHERGVAWVFQKSRNPWAKDKWYQKENEKIWNKHKHP